MSDSSLIINVGNVTITFSRGDTVGQIADCVYCMTPTTRATLFKLASELGHARMVRCCDGCHDGLRKVPARDDEKPGILKGTA